MALGGRLISQARVSSRSSSNVGRWRGGGGEGGHVAASVLVLNCVLGRLGGGVVTAGRVPTLGGGGGDVGGLVVVSILVVAGTLMLVAVLTLLDTSDEERIFVSVVPLVFIGIDTDVVLDIDEEARGVCVEGLKGVVSSPVHATTKVKAMMKMLFAIVT